MINEKCKSWIARYTIGRDRTNAPVYFDGNGHKRTSAWIAEQWLKLRNDLPEWEYASTEDIQKYLEDNAPEIQQQSNTMDERALQRAMAAQAALANFVDCFNDGYVATYTGSSYILVKKNLRYQEQIPVKTVANEIRLQMKMDLQTPPPSEDCVAAIENILAEAKRTKRDDALALVEYDPAVKERGFSFKGWTEQLFAHYKIKNTKLNRKMWRYMMHSIKRAAFGLRGPDSKIMYLIFSRVQGIGKSRLLRHLCDPFIGAFNASATLGQLVDDNSIKALCSEGTALIDFQELGLGKQASASSSVDLAAMLKRIITMDEHKARELYTSTNTTTLVNAVFASSTNLHISEVVQDSDYRRYYTFESEMTKGEAIQKDWSEVDAFFKDTLTDAYKFLPEAEIPTLDSETMITLRAEQETYARRVDLITQWLNEQKLVIVDESDSDKADVKSIDIHYLYKKFKVFTDQCGLPQYSQQRMQQLIASSCDILPTNVDGKIYYYVKEGK